MNRLNLDKINRFLSAHQLIVLDDTVQAALKTRLSTPHGDWAKWRQACEQLPNYQILHAHGDIQLIIDDAVRLQADFNHFIDEVSLKNALQQLMPWRKGPFALGSIYLDSEWKSQLKWQRLQALNIDFVDQCVLDVGCGNGYFMWQLQQSGAQTVLGLDPSWLFYAQFMLFQHYVRSSKLCFLPLGIEAVPEIACFDKVLSMGVLYHRKSPIEHLQSLKALLNPQGQLILETIVLNDGTESLRTPERYAGMNNVWALSDLKTLQSWIEAAGLRIVQVGDVVKTTLCEQRQTEWMQFYSLNQFLQVGNDALTIEGLPAPARVIVVAERR